MYSLRLKYNKVGWGIFLRGFLQAMSYFNFLSCDSCPNCLVLFPYVFSSIDSNLEKMESEKIKRGIVILRSQISPNANKVNDLSICDIFVCVLCFPHLSVKLYDLIVCLLDLLSAESNLGH